MFQIYDIWYMIIFINLDKKLKTLYSIKKVYWIKHFLLNEIYMYIIYRLLKNNLFKNKYK